MADGECGRYTGEGGGRRRGGEDMRGGVRVNTNRLSETTCYC